MSGWAGGGKKKEKVLRFWKGLRCRDWKAARRRRGQGLIQGCVASLHADRLFSFSTAFIKHFLDHRRFSSVHSWRCCCEMNDVEAFFPLLLHHNAAFPLLLLHPSGWHKKCWPFASCCVLSSSFSCCCWEPFSFFSSLLLDPRKRSHRLCAINC